MFLREVPEKRMETPLPSTCNLREGQGPLPPLSSEDVQGVHVAADHVVDEVVHLALLDAVWPYPRVPYPPVDVDVELGHGAHRPEASRTTRIFPGLRRTEAITATSTCSQTSTALPPTSLLHIAGGPDRTSRTGMCLDGVRTSLFKLLILLTCVGQ
eukprot:CAMPEP_0177613024 /NCGR_PEP_ID=MMETSP0419_2-20121207/21673_1 /TAXON_ID=582737 /ORGANISM="Tetraselmis sp., Strain GSL018" /LENGTH=155 /DNA_ID=CAMNT_0019109531 /DNA_START=1466 /DNA_END=1935 /DNA_ORIENTATION=-